MLHFLIVTVTLLLARMGRYRTARARLESRSQRSHPLSQLRSSFRTPRRAGRLPESRAPTIEAEDVQDGFQGAAALAAPWSSTAAFFSTICNTALHGEDTTPIKSGQKKPPTVGLENAPDADKKEMASSSIFGGMFTSEGTSVCSLLLTLLHPPSHIKCIHEVELTLGAIQQERLAS